MVLWTSDLQRLKYFWAGWKGMSLGEDVVRVWGGGTTLRGRKEGKLRERGQSRDWSGSRGGGGREIHTLKSIPYLACNAYYEHNFLVWWHEGNTIWHLNLKRKKRKSHLWCWPIVQAPGRCRAQQIVRLHVLLKPASHTSKTYITQSSHTSTPASHSLHSPVHLHHTVFTHQYTYITQS